MHDERTVLTKEPSCTEHDENSKTMRGSCAGNHDPRMRRNSMGGVRNGVNGYLHQGDSAASTHAGGRMTARPR